MIKFKNFDDYMKSRRVRAADPQKKPRVFKIKEKGELANIRLDAREGTFYWAYGSNLSERAMAIRCPGAIKIQPLTLKNGALVFRGVADVVTRKGAQVHGGLWWITQEHEATLDAYEGVHSRFYLKKYLQLRFKGIPEPIPCLYYVMNMRRGVDPPNEHYLATLIDGYRDFGLPLRALEKAVDAAWDNKLLTPILRERRKRRGGKLVQRLDQLSGLAYGCNDDQR
jgi:hypothetical protein